MGAYLSQPVTKKLSSDEYGKRVDCAASSMQGWRISQEDAHNSILDFDTDTSLFAVYDGHGGHEVAEYCAKYFPEFLKKCEKYTKVELIEALKEAFLGFDATLATPEVIDVLKEMSGKKDAEENSLSDVDEENVTNLREEAEMPLDQVIAKYQNDMNQHLKNAKSSGAGLDKSPYLRSRRACTSSDDMSSTSGSGAGSSSSSSTTEIASSSGSVGQNSNCIELKEPKSESDTVFDSTTSNGVNNTSAKSEEETKAVTQESETPNPSNEKNEATGSMQKEENKTEKSKTESSVHTSDEKQEVNGEVGASGDGKHVVDSGDVVDNSSPHENGIAPSEGKGKGKAIISQRNLVVNTKNHMALRPNAADLYKSLLGAPETNDSESDSDDEGDENFEGVADSSDDDPDEGEDNEEGDGEEEEEEDDDSLADDEEDDEEDDDDDCTMKMTEEPGSDSGCTAVVALLRGRELYVANAGDSRCIVCRKGQAIDMSLDHKPEDEAEMERIVKAGGKVTADGRVNGGLNLSRALGDHAYKLNSSLPPEEQMITAQPDVRTLLLDPLEDEFIFLACDGIWNFMSSQEVCDFLQPRMKEESKKLSEICEELFDYCLAPDTLGDGTGCDNMTAVLVRIKPEVAEVDENRPAKRQLSPAKEEGGEKRPRTEETV